MARRVMKVDPKDQRKIDRDTFITIKKLFKYLRPHRTFMIFTIVLGIIGTGFEVIGPFIMGNTTNYVIESFKANSFQIQNFLKYIYILLGLYVLSYLAETFRLRIANRVKVSIVYELREELSRKMKKLPVSFFDKNPVGDMLSKMTNDIQTIGDSINQVVDQIFNSLVVIIGVLAIMLYISPILTLITILVVPLTILASVKIVRESQKSYSLQYKNLGEMNSHIEEIFSSNKLVKAYNYEEHSLNEFLEKNEKLRKSAARSEFLSGITVPIATFINNLGVVGISIVGAYLLLKGKINIGNFQSFTQYSRRFTRPIQEITNIMSVLQSGIAASERVFEVLEAKEEIEDSKEDISIEEIRPNIKFENISFGYNEEKIIKNLSLDIKEGSTVAIVGPTGSGKTTLVNLIMRFYDVSEGKISIDGIDIKSFRRTDLRNYLSMVLQDTWLFEGTIAENIAYGKDNVSKKEIVEAAKNAYAHDFIMKLPNEYETVLEENASNISEGEKQLITIARALIANPKIMILDEATSSIDTRTEKLIQKAMEKLVEARTSFIIAHRLSTIVNADLILVLNNGTIIEKGSHKELLEQNGFYKELYSSQF